ncbi:predicted protein [Postia placenta Mad-698-R]|nr:predicted protein [Postia placenta Mad-698-R]
MASISWTSSELHLWHRLRILAFCPKYSSSFPFSHRVRREIAAGRSKLAQNGYAKSASLVLAIRCELSCASFHGSEKEARLAPIVQLLQRETSGSSSHRGVLVHALSNAGGLHIVKLRRVLSRLHESMPATTSGPRIPTALVLDSAPSANLLSLAINIFAPDNPVMHMLSLPPLLVLYVIFSTTVRLSGYPPLLRELRETLNTPGLLPTVTPDTDPTAMPRLYIYSDGDRVTPAHEVEAHIGEARARGFEVRVERFDRTSHVAHMREDPARYWRAVNRLWARASSAVPGSPALASL